MKITITGNLLFRVSDLTEHELESIQKVYSYKVDVYVWNAKARRRELKGTKDKVIPKINKKGRWAEFALGFIFSFVNIYRKSLTKDQIVEIQKSMSSDFQVNNWYTLEDRDDTYNYVTNLTKYCKGVLQRPTGKGKTEIIATLAKNALDKGMKVLIISENTPVLHENRDRLRNKMGVICPDYFDDASDINIIKPSGFCRSNWYNPITIQNYFSKVDMILADEVESTVTNTFNSLFLKMPNVKYMYGFSATANKLIGDGMPKDDRLTKALNRCVEGVVAYYGFTNEIVLPYGLEIEVLVFQTNFRIHPDLTEYHQVNYKISTHRKFHNIINKLVNEEGLTVYIPCNRKLAFYESLDEPIFRGIKTLMISGDGYTVHEEGKMIQKTNLEGAKNMLRNKEVKLLLGTASSYRGLDFNGIDAIITIFEGQDALVKQMIGRLTRETNFKIVLINNDTVIPYITYFCRRNMKMIKNYFKNCKLTWRNVDFRY